MKEEFPQPEKINSSQADQLLEFMREAARLDDERENLLYWQEFRGLDQAETERLKAVIQEGNKLIESARKQGLPFSTFEPIARSLFNTFELVAQVLFAFLF